MFLMDPGDPSCFRTFSFHPCQQSADAAPGVVPDLIHIPKHYRARQRICPNGLQVFIC